MKYSQRGGLLFLWMAGTFIACGVSPNPAVPPQSPPPRAPVPKVPNPLVIALRPTELALGGKRVALGSSLESATDRKTFRATVAAEVAGQLASHEGCTLAVSEPLPALVVIDALVAIAEAGCVDVTLEHSLGTQPLRVLQSPSDRTLKPEQTGLYVELGADVLSCRPIQSAQVNVQQGASPAPGASGVVPSHADAKTELPQVESHAFAFAGDTATVAAHAEVTLLRHACPVKPGADSMLWLEPRQGAPLELLFRTLLSFSEGGSSPLRVAFRTDEGGAALEDEAVQSTVRRSSLVFRKCYDEGRKKLPNLKGTLQLQVTVTRSGQVENVEVVPTPKSRGVVPMNHTEVTKCVVDAFRQLEFPPSTEGRRITYPFVFTPKD